MTGPILTLGYGSFSDSGKIVTLGYGAPAGPVSETHIYNIGMFCVGMGLSG